VEAIIALRQFALNYAGKRFINLTVLFASKCPRFKDEDWSGGINWSQPCFFIGRRARRAGGIASSDIFFEASHSTDGFIVLDFVKGAVIEGDATESLKRVVGLYQVALITLCAKQNCDYSEIVAVTARYGIDAAYGPHLSVAVQVTDGRHSTDRYVGSSGKRLV
jgi:hypothetical protein